MEYQVHTHPPDPPRTYWLYYKSLFGGFIFHVLLVQWVILKFCLFLAFTFISWILNSFIYTSFFLSHSVTYFPSLLLPKHSFSIARRYPLTFCYAQQQQRHARSFSVGSECYFIHHVGWMECQTWQRSWKILCYLMMTCKWDAVERETIWRSVKVAQCRGKSNTLRWDTCRIFLLQVLACRWHYCHK